jgi:hypothetical protein
LSSKLNHPVDLKKRPNFLDKNKKPNNKRRNGIPWQV